ncbi:MAG: ABC transporter permease, partial [Blautia coccoides]
MKILREYTLDFIRRNKRTSCAIMIALYLASTFLSALCGFINTMWRDTITLTVFKSGDWHGELFGEAFGRDLPLIKGYSTVDDVLIKGNFITADIEDPRREYLSLRCANAAYWKHMPEKNELTDGRIPEASNEIAISKQYFENHPELKIGDTITLPMGERVKDGTILEATEPLRSGETFSKREERTFTIVGILDAATPSTVPSYYAMGYMEDDDIRPEESITVYLRFRSMRNTYEDLPKIAALIGWEKDEYGEYNLKYNTDLLSQHFVFPKEQFHMDNALEALAFPIMFLFLAVLVVGLFVLIIHNAFSLSANSRVTQLGILASIGASPRQIRQSVIWEGLFLMLLPLPAGLATGWFLDHWLIQYVNSINDAARSGNIPKVTFSYGLPSILPAILLTFFTVWFSARIPARKIARLTPIEAIRRGEAGNIKKTRSRHILSRFFGIEGELASSALSARKKSYRTATISLT